MNKTRISFIIAAVLVFFVVGSFAISRKNNSKNHRFDNLLVITPSDYMGLITPGHKDIKALAQRLKTPVNLYYFVRDFIAFEPSLSTLTAEKTLENRTGNCLSKSVLLCSLYKSLDIPDENLRIIVGEINYKDTTVEHAWVEVKHDGIWLQQDTTDLLGRFEFADFPGRSYSKSFGHREGFCFNSSGFAVVSQMNRMR